jgi:hypothetical protein
MALGAAVTIGIGATVQVVAPGPALIVLLDSGVFAEGSEFSGDSSLYVAVDYEASEQLSREPGAGSVFEMVLEGTPEITLGVLGEIFSVEGEPSTSEYFSPEWPGYSLGSEDWSGPSIVLTWNGSGSWYYTDPAAYPEPICEEVPAPEGSGKPPGFECVPAVADLPLPSEAEAREMAWEKLTAAGLEAERSDINILTNDEWGIGVSVASKVGGEPTALEWTMFWAPGPVLASASGHSASAINRGEFETLSPFDTVERLASGSWWGAPAIDYDHLDEDFHAHDGPLVQDGPQESTLTISAATSTSLLVWDSEGGQWIVPGYFLSFGEDEWERTAVISLGEDVLRIEAPASLEPEPGVDDARRK